MTPNTEAPTPSPPETKYCEVCGAVFERTPGRLGESRWSFRRRRFCSNECSDAARLPGRVPDLLEMFPGAVFRHATDAPPACTACGNPWWRRGSALACVVCGTRAYVGEWLAEEARLRGFCPTNGEETSLVYRPGRRGGSEG